MSLKAKTDRKRGRNSGWDVTGSYLGAAHELQGTLKDEADGDGLQPRPQPLDLSSKEGGEKGEKETFFSSQGFRGIKELDEGLSMPRKVKGRSVLGEGSPPREDPGSRVQGPRSRV